MTKKSDYIDVEAPVRDASPEVKRIIQKVLVMEKDKLYLDRPHVVSDIVDIIKEEIKSYD